MPQLPQIEETVPAAVPRAPRLGVTGPSEAFGALMQFGDVLLKTSQKLSAAQEAIDLSGYRAQIAKRVAEIDLGLKGNPDPQKHHQNFMTQLGTVEQEYLGLQTTPPVKSELQFHFNQLKESWAVKSMYDQVGFQHDKLIGDAQRLRTDSLSKLFFIDTDDERQNIIGEQISRYSALEGVLSPEQIEGETVKFLRDADYTIGMRMIQVNPSEFLNRTTDIDPEAAMKRMRETLPNLDLPTFFTLRDHAQNVKEQRAREDLEHHEKLETMIYEKHYLDAINGTLSEDELNKDAVFLGGPRVENIRDAKVKMDERRAKKTIEGNPIRFEFMRRDLYAGEWSGQKRMPTEAELHAAILKENLNGDQAKSLSDDFQSVQRFAEAKNKPTYEAYEKIIKAKFAVSFMDLEPSKTKQKEATVLKHWNELQMTGMTPEAAFKEVDRVYQIQKLAVIPKKTALIKARQRYSRFTDQTSKNVVKLLDAMVGNWEILKEIEETGDTESVGFSE